MAHTILEVLSSSAGGGKIIERSHFLVGRQAAKATVTIFENLIQKIASLRHNKLQDSFTINNWICFFHFQHFKYTENLASSNNFGKLF